MTRAESSRFSGLIDTNILSIAKDSPLHVPRLSFGTGSLHHVFSAKERQNILLTALNTGLSHFDTSPYYGYGLAEQDLGTFLKGKRARVTLATKAGLYPYGYADSHAAGVWLRKAIGKVSPRFSRPAVTWEVDRAKHELRASLRRLKTDFVDVLFLHEPRFGPDQADELLRWLESERALGTIRCWGLAGEANRVSSWVRAGHPLAMVVQTRDSMSIRQADFMLDCQRPLQFTYGYQSSQAGAATPGQYLDVLRAALARNKSGSVIVSSRKAERVAQLAKVIA